MSITIIAESKKRIMSYEIKIKQVIQFMNNAVKMWCRGKIHINEQIMALATILFQIVMSTLFKLITSNIIKS